MKVPLLYFVGCPGTPLLNFEGDPGLPLLEGSQVPLLNFEGSPGSRSPGPTFTPCPFISVNLSQASLMIINYDHENISSVNFIRD